MKRNRSVRGLALLISLFVHAAGKAGAATGRDMAFDCAASFRDARVESTVLTMPLWTWVKIRSFDETYPLGVDIVGSNFEPPTKVLYVLHGGSTNFKSTFFTPALGKNLAHFFREKGYLVVGITAREDAVPTGIPYHFMADWGLSKHRDDIRRVVEKVHSAVHLPQEMLGHSYGAAYALAYAERYSDSLQRLVILDVDGADPAAEPQRVAMAQSAFEAYQMLLAQGVFADTTLGSMKAVALMSILMPDGDSGESRELLGLPGSFTFNGLFHYSLINTASMPGITTPITGLPSEYSLVQSYVAGRYVPASDPKQDTYQLHHSRLNRMRAVTLELGAALVPLAVARDWASITAYNGFYSIDWAAIRLPVVWVNSELGYGSQTHLAELIRQGGNPSVHVSVIPGYGHADVLYSSNAEVDVWRLLAP